MGCLVAVVQGSATDRSVDIKPIYRFILQCLYRREYEAVATTTTTTTTTICSPMPMHPIMFKVNEFIIGGYRPEMSMQSAMRTVFMWHNETLFCLRYMEFKRYLACIHAIYANIRVVQYLSLYRVYTLSHCTVHIPSPFRVL
jgi:hypothetical protein